MVVSSLLTEAGFESAEKASVETLTEMLQSCECGAFGAGLGPPPLTTTSTTWPWHQRDENLVE